MRKVLLITVLSTAFLLAAAILATPAEAQWSHCDCQTCKEIGGGWVFPIWTCWPQLSCNTYGFCGCSDVNNACRLFDDLCYNDCITVT